MAATTDSKSVSERSESSSFSQPTSQVYTKLWFHRITGSVHGPFKAEIRVQASVELRADE